MREHKKLLCGTCGKEKEPGERHGAQCVGCGRKVMLCAGCLIKFAGCSDKCKAAHREKMQSAWGEKIVGPATE